MAIRKISDLPYMTEDQMNVNDRDAYHKVSNSSLELSYLSATGDFGSTYVSRQIKFIDMVHMLSGSILGGDEILEFNKFVKFNRGLSATFVQAGSLSVTNGAHISGNVYINATPSGTNGKSYVGKFAFGGGLDLYAITKIHPKGYVDSTTDESTSIVNVGYLTTKLNDLENRLQSQIDDLARRIEALEALLGSSDDSEIGARSIWPVGSVYITTLTSDTCPIQSLDSSWTWEKLDKGAYLFAAGTLTSGEEYAPGTDIEPGLPKIEGETTWIG